MRIIRLFVVLMIAVSAYAQDAQTFAANLRAGESINGFPNWSERVILEWMNRARVDPQYEMRVCGAACGEAACYRPIAPLAWDEALNHSARFHVDEMTRQQYFAHDSKCAIVTNINSLYPTACDGSASCACGSGSPTAWNVRVGMFGGGATGEIIASAAEPNAAFYLWLYEQSSTQQCSFTSANGHRFLILASLGSVGVGLTTQAVGDFGGNTNTYKIPSAAHYPKQAATVTLWANWYDGNAPKSVNAIVDGNCTPMTLQRGTPLNGSWSANANNVGAGCHRYYFSFVDSTGVEIMYPATGSLGIGGNSCDDWNASRLTGKCATGSPVTPPPTTTPAKRRAVKRH